MFHYPFRLLFQEKGVINFGICINFVQANIRLDGNISTYICICITERS